MDVKEKRVLFFWMFGVFSAILTVSTLLYFLILGVLLKKWKFGIEEGVVSPSGFFVEWFFSMFLILVISLFMICFGSKIIIRWVLK